MASLAGLSIDYYARLEQGREQHPSASVLNALGRALRLGADAQRYLFAVATPGPTPATARVHRQVGADLLALVDEWPHHPAVIIDRCATIVAANQLGRAMYAGHRRSDNLARLLFVDEDARTFFRDWTKVATASVAAIRASATLDPDDAELMALVGELSVRSAEFSRLWSKAEVREKTSDSFQIRHPQVGDLNLVFESLRPNGSPDLFLRIYGAEPGSSTAEALAVLGAPPPTRPSCRRSGTPDRGPPPRPPRIVLKMPAAAPAFSTGTVLTAALSMIPNARPTPAPKGSSGNADASHDPSPCRVAMSRAPATISAEGGQHRPHGGARGQLAGGERQDQDRGCHRQQEQAAGQSGAGAHPLEVGTASWDRRARPSVRSGPATPPCHRDGSSHRPARDGCVRRCDRWSRPSRRHQP